MFKVLKEINLQLRLLYKTKISFKTDGEVKSFTDKQKLTEISTIKPVLQQILKRLYIQSTQEKGTTYKNKPKSIKKMPIRTYLSQLP